MKNILITGAGGFIGSRCVEYARKAGWNCKLLSRSEIQGYDTVKFNLMTDSVDRLNLEGIDAVIHLAGVAHNLKTPTSLDDKMYKEVNVCFSEKLARKSIEFNVKRFIFVSSIKAGGIPIMGKIHDESFVGKVDGIYGESKLEAESRLLSLQQKYDYGLTIIRPALVYGSNVKGNLKSMLNLIRKGICPPLPEVNNKRSMIHVDDLVIAIFHLIDNDSSIANVYNATDNEYYSARKIYENLCRSLSVTPHSWSVPKIFFDFAGLFSPKLNDSISKLFSDACFSSYKLNHLGFKAVFKLKNINQKLF